MKKNCLLPIFFTHIRLKSGESKEEKGNSKFKIQNFLYPFIIGVKRHSTEPAKARIGVSNVDYI